MKRSLLAAAAVALVAAGTAQAKGPSKAEVSGPGLKNTIVLRGDESGPSTPLGSFADGIGFYQAAYDQQPSQMLARRPQKKLGPKYRVTYTVPGPGGMSVLRQDVYPYAKPNPVAYMRPGQTFFGDMKSHGGWFVASPDVKSTLVTAGLPRHAPSSSSAGFGVSSAWGVAAFAGALALLAVAGAVRVRRSRR